MKVAILLLHPGTARSKKMANKLYYDDVAVGQSLPVLAKHPDYPAVSDVGRRRRSFMNCIMIRTLLSPKACRG